MIEALMENKVIPAPASAPAASAADWFEQARFGLFVHWGIYALLGDENAEWVLFKSKLDRSEYNRLATKFKGECFDADQLVALAKKAGMGYMVLTTRHHDGFCLFDTSTTDFNSVRTAAGRDFVREFVEACRRADLKVGLYYSIMSWQQPAIYGNPEDDLPGWEKMVKETHDQVQELMTNYGKIDLLWYDGAVVPGIQDKGIQARFWRSRELNSMVKKLQPNILINNRSGLPEDFDTPEQHVRPPEPGRRWEACMTINRSWGYNIHDRNFKTPGEIIKCLIRCARYNGNLLLNIGPRGDGSIQQECLERLHQVGNWLQRNGEAIYGVQRIPFTEADHVAGTVTYKDPHMYIHIAKYTGPAILIDGVGGIEDAEVLGSNKPLIVSPGTGASALIKGITEDCFTTGPIVIKLRPRNKLRHPANLLGGGDELRLDNGNAPVLGDDPDRFAPPVEPVRTGTLLAEYLCSSIDHKLEASEAWCPGWAGWRVITPIKGHALQANFEVPYLGKYCLEMGIISEQAKDFEILLDGNPLAGKTVVKNPGFPDTWSFPELAFTSGIHRLTIKGDCRFGFYALRLAPIWRVMPSDCWYTVGPFPTGFGPQQPISEVRKAMAEIFPPQKDFDLSFSYEGAKGIKVKWQHSLKLEGDHSNCGVDFPYRCGTHASGVCFARTVISSPAARKAKVMLGCDWWANLYVNGQMIKTNRDPEICEEDGAQFNTWKPVPAEIDLQAGDNVILVKCHPGTCANWFSFRISDPGDLEVKVK